jgi:predicted Zn finger-like uncharacterized protein
MQTVCPSCAKKLSVPDSAVGKKIRCPKCSAVFTLSTTDESERRPAPKSGRPPTQKRVAPASNLDDEEESDTPRPSKSPSRSARRDDDGARESPRRRVGEEDEAAGESDEIAAQRRASFASIIQRVGAYVGLFFHVVIATVILAFLGPGTDMHVFGRDMLQLIVFFGGVGAVILFFVVLIVLGASQLKKFGSPLLSWIGCIFSLLACIAALVGVGWSLRLTDHFRFSGYFEMVPMFFLIVFGLTALLNLWGAIQAMVALCSANVNAMFCRPKARR